MSLLFLVIQSMSVADLCKTNVNSPADHVEWWLPRHMRNASTEHVNHVVCKKYNNFVVHDSAPLGEVRDSLPPAGVIKHHASCNTYQRYSQPCQIFILGDYVQSKLTPDFSAGALPAGAWRP